MTITMTTTTTMMTTPRSFTSPVLSPPLRGRAASALVTPTSLSGSEVEGGYIEYQQLPDYTHPQRKTDLATLPSRAFILSLLYPTIPPWPSPSSSRGLHQIATTSNPDSGTRTPLSLPVSPYYNFEGCLRRNSEAVGFDDITCL